MNSQSAATTPAPVGTNAMLALLTRREAELQEAVLARTDAETMADHYRRLAEKAEQQSVRMDELIGDLARKAAKLLDTAEASRRTLAEAETQIAALRFENRALKWLAMPLSVIGFAIGYWNLL